jgi:hypothetical protein
MPGRSTLARRLRKQSVDTVDRAMKELVGLGAVSVEHRRDGTRQLTNRYLVRTLPAKGGRSDAAAPSTPAAPPAAVPASVNSAATLPGRNSAAGGTGAVGPGRSDAAPRAAGMRPDPEFFTQSPALPPPAPTAAPTPERLAGGEGDPNSQLLTACGINDLDRFAAEVQRLRRDLGQPSVRWSGPCLVAALQLAVKVRSWPAMAARQALLTVAADGRTRSPMRLAEAGPWWNHAAKQILQRTPQEQAELDGLEHLLADCDDRALLQREARSQLSAEGVPLNRLTVARRAARLLEHKTEQADSPPAASRALNPIGRSANSRSPMPRRRAPVLPRATSANPSHMISTDAAEIPAHPTDSLNQGRFRLLTPGPASGANQGGVGLASM